MSRKDLNPERAAMIAAFYQRYCEDAIASLQAGQYVDDPVLEVSLSDLARHNRDLYDDLVTNPDTVKGWFETVANNYEEVCENAFNDPNITADITLVSHPLPDDSVVIELTDPPSMLIRDIGKPRGEKFNQLVAFEGVCQQTSDPKPRLIEGVFECERCGTFAETDASKTFELENAAPLECSGCERQGPFSIKDKQSTYEEYQQIRVQEPPEDAINTTNPREIVCDAQGKHLVDNVEPGNRVTVVGMLAEDKDNDSTLRDDRLKVESVICEETQFEDVEFDDEDVEQIEELADTENVFELLKQSIAPTIYGFEDEKLAIALQLFGGVSKSIYGNRKRGEIHILFIGDPGVGKSQLLKFAQTIAPRAVQSGGTGSTSVGLTATAVKEQIGNEEQWTVQAGSLVLADGGLITIDELDNMREEQQQSLDQALSDGEIDVDKADVHTTLNARCSALMAANPTEGRFNPYDPYPEQFGIPKELLDRCDLVFAPRDTPDTGTDAAVADTILDAHIDEPATADGGQPMAVDESGVINPDLLQKYIAYARRDYNPRLSDDAADRLKDFYTDLRETLSSENDDGTAQMAINARGLEGLRRLSQAAARVQLSDVVTADHAQTAIDLVMESLNQTIKDPDGNGYDIDRLANGAASPSQRDRVDTIKSIVKDLQQEYEEGAPKQAVYNQAAEHGIEESTALHEIEKLRQKGTVYEPQEDYYRVV
jgi:replicative DNA helicase Mcm